MRRSDTPYDQVISRCVRRALLRGVDQCSGGSYAYRRGRIEDRIRVQYSLFRGLLLERRYRVEESLSELERNSVGACAAVYRKRLGNLSS